MFDLSLSLRFKLTTIYEKSLERSEFIIGNFLSVIRENLFVNEKVTQHLGRVINIQRQWRTIFKKKRLFIYLIKKLWADYLVMSYYELLEEKNKEQGNVVPLEIKKYYFFKK